MTAATPSYNEDQVIEEVVSDRKNYANKIVVDEALSDATQEFEVLV